MLSIAQTPDARLSSREALMTAGLEMACESVNRYYALPTAARRDLLAAWAAFIEDLAACGVARPTAPKGL